MASDSAHFPSLQSISSDSRRYSNVVLECIVVFETGSPLNTKPKLVGGNDGRVFASGINNVSLSG